MSSIKDYLILMRFDKPIGILLLLWPTLWALWLATGGTPSIGLICIFVTGVIIMRAAGCIINDIADRHLDGHVARTRKRPLATGALSLRQAQVAFASLLGAAFILVLLLNKLALLLSLFAVVLATSYPFLKRYTHFPQTVLGLAFSWGILMAFATIQNHIPIIALILFLSGALWTVVYDTEYAMVDREDDIKIGMKSTAILFGQQDRLIIALLQLVVLLLWCYCGWLMQANMFYYTAIMLAALLFLYQQYLIFKRSPAKCFKAFLNNNWVGMLMFIGIALQFYR